MAQHKSLSEIPSNQIDKRTERKVRGAMSKLILDHPFFAVLLLQQKMTYTIEVPTMATDGTSIFINPLYAKDLTKLEIMGVLVHELYHIILMHMTRRGNRDPIDFNKACDYSINPIVKHEGFILPTIHLDDKKYHGMIADKIYKLIQKDKPNLPNYVPDVLYVDSLSEYEKQQ
jgi:predicted metal-dependent peptidase